MRITYSKVKRRTKTNPTNNKVKILISGISGDRVIQLLPFNVQDDDWSDGYPINKKHTLGLRTSLDTLKTHLEKWYYESISENQSVDSGDVIQEIRGWTGESVTNLSLYDALDACIAHKIETCSQDRVKIFRQLKQRLLQYNPKLTFRQANKVVFGDILKSQVFAFSMVTPNKRIQTPTINNLIEAFNHLLSWSYEREHLKNRPIALKMLSTDEQEIVALTASEIEVLESHQFDMSKKRQRTNSDITDLFLMSCYTSLRCSDVSFDASTLENNQVKITIIKTDEIFTLRLIPEAMDILKKHNYELPLVKTSLYNLRLKEIFETVGLDREVMQIRQYPNQKKKTVYMPLYKHISTHNARKTFITTCLSNGIPPYQAMKLSNHKNIKSFERYIAFSDSDLTSEIQKISRRTPTPTPPVEPFTEGKQTVIQGEVKDDVTELERLQEELNILEIKKKIRQLREEAKGKDGDDVVDLKIVS